MNLNDPRFKHVGVTIRSISEAESERFFKTGANNVERSSFVLSAILSRIALALHDLGLSIKEITQDIDPTDIVVEVMLSKGYDFGGDNPTVEYSTSLNIER